MAPAHALILHTDDRPGALLQIAQVIADHLVRLHDALEMPHVVDVGLLGRIAAFLARLFPATGLEDRSATTALATVTATVPAGRESWVPFGVDCRLTTPFVWFWIPRTAGPGRAAGGAGSPRRRSRASRSGSRSTAPIR